MPATYRRLGDRNPYELYLLVLAALSSTPAALGLARPPASVRIQLDPISGQIWAAALALGSLIALIGLVWRRPHVGLSVTGLLLEQVGLVIAGVATVFYCMMAFATVGWDAAPPVGTVLAFGLASFAQAEKIENVIWALKHPDQPPRPLRLVRIYRRTLRPVVTLIHGLVSR